MESEDKGSIASIDVEKVEIQADEELSSRQTNGVVRQRRREECELSKGLSNLIDKVHGSLRY